MRKDKGFLVSLPADLKEELKIRAEKEDLTMSQVIRKGLREYLAKSGE
jgi:metal-responsive CopG/Arc/MetJ family transcriptional regulator